MTESAEDPGTARRAERLGALLRDADDAPRSVAFPAARIARARRQRRVARWRMAAVVALLLAPLLHQPVRAWVVERLQGAWRVLAGETAAGPAAPAITAPAPASPSSVSFTPAAGPFTLRVAVRQAAGALTIRFVDGATARAQVLDGGAGEWLVRPDGVELHNAATATAGVLVEVPRQSPNVALVIGGRAIAVARDTTVQLASPAP